MEIGALPRGEIISRGNVGEYPKGSARPISVLGQGSPIAISERQGRSPKIVYRDPLTDALAEGWLWAGSAELLDDGSGAITRRRKRRASRKPIFDDVIMVQEFGSQERHGRRDRCENHGNQVFEVVRLGGAGGMRSLVVEGGL